DRRALPARLQRAAHPEMAAGPPWLLLDNQAAPVHPHDVLRGLALPAVAGPRCLLRGVPSDARRLTPVPRAAPGAVRRERLRHPSVPLWTTADASRLQRSGLRRVQRADTAGPSARPAPGRLPIPGAATDLQHRVRLH